MFGVSRCCFVLFDTSNRVNKKEKVYLFTTQPVQTVHLVVLKKQKKALTKFDDLLEQFRTILKELALGKVPGVRTGDKIDNLN